MGEAIMIIKSSAVLRNDYASISDYPIYITRNGEGDVVLMNIEAFEKSPTFNREKKVAEEIKNIGHVTAVTNTGTTGNDNKTSAPSGGGTIRFFMDPDCYGLD